MKRTWFTEEQCARAKRLREGGYSFEEIAVRMGTTKSRIHKLSKRGWKRHTFDDRPRPGDLSLRASEMKFNELKAFYKVGAPQLRAWLDEGGIQLPERHRAAPRRPMPKDFREVAARLSHVELQAHYGATGYVVTRWKVEAGVPTPRRDYNQRRKQAASKPLGWAESYYRTRIAA